MPKFNQLNESINEKKQTEYNNMINNRTKNIEVPKNEIFPSTININGSVEGWLL